MTRDKLGTAVLSILVHPYKTVSEKQALILAVADEYAAHEAERVSRPPLKTRPGDWARRPGVTRYWPQDGAS